jgi:transcriptional regulator with XRE-family HTH domain
MPVSHTRTPSIAAVDAGIAVTQSPIRSKRPAITSHRGVSQLALASRAGTTSRHVSFLETGRSRPSREMVLRLGRALAVPLRGVNDLLTAAGLAPAYPHTPFQAEDLARRRGDDARRSSALSGAGARRPHQRDPRQLRLQTGSSAWISPDATSYAISWPIRVRAKGIDNWPLVAWAGLDRLRTLLDRSPFDAELARLVRVAESALASTPRPETAAGTPLTVCPRFRRDGRLIRAIVIAARFDAPVEVTLDELHIELIYPADAESEAFFRGTSATSAAGSGRT